MGVQHITAPSEIQETLWTAGLGTTGFTSATAEGISDVDLEAGPLSIKTLHKTDFIPYKPLTIKYEAAVREKQNDIPD